jgi:hypothetical protein
MRKLELFTIGSVRGRTANDFTRIPRFRTFWPTLILAKPVPSSSSDAGPARFAERLLSDWLPSDCRYHAADVSTTMVRLTQARLAPWQERAHVVQTGGAMLTKDVGDLQPRAARRLRSANAQPRRNMHQN